MRNSLDSQNNPMDDVGNTVNLSFIDEQTGFQEVKEQVGSFGGTELDSTSVEISLGLS